MNNSNSYLDNFFSKTEHLAATGNLTEAEKLLRELIDSQDLTIARAHNDSGVIAWQEGKTDKALEHYQQAVKLAPENPVYRKNLADLLYFGMGEIENALAHYRHIIADTPRDFDATLAIGRICADLGKHFLNEATDFFTLAEGIRPGDGFVACERERLNQNSNDNTQSERETANMAISGDPTTDYEKFTEKFTSQEIEKTEKVIIEFIKQYPDFALAHNDLGVISHQLEKLDQTEDSYLKAVQLEPQNITFRKNLADFLFIVKEEPEMALAHYHEVLKTAPKDIETLMMIGNICLALDSKEEARNFFNLVLEIEPWSSNAGKAIEMLDDRDKDCDEIQ